MTAPNPTPPAPNPVPPSDPLINPPAPTPTPAPANLPKPPDDEPKSGADTDTRIKALEESLSNTGAERDNLKGILEKLGAVLNPDKSKQDPETLAKTLSEREAELKASKLELAVLRVAGDKGADLLDSRKFMASIKDLEPGSEAFEAKVKEAADAKPLSTKKPKSGGAELNGGSTGTKEQLTRADLRGMSEEDIVKAESEGRLTALLSGKG